MVDTPITVEEFVEAFPEFAGVAETKITAMLERATCFITVEGNPIFGEKCAVFAYELVVAHLLTLLGKVETKTQTGFVSSSSIGSVSVSLVAPTNKTQLEYWLNQTPYGQQYLALLRAKTPTGMYLGGSCQRVFR